MKDNDDFDDFFDGPDLPDKEEPAPPEPTPEEIEERTERENTIDVPRLRRLRRIIAAAALVVLLLMVWLYFRYYSVQSESQVKGYIVEVQRTGRLFKTIEGKMVTEMAVDDTTHFYRSDFPFTIENDSIANIARYFQGRGRKVTLHYKHYRGRLFWRRESHDVVTAITAY